MKFGSVWHWYQLDSKYSLELLTAHVKSVEAQIERSIRHYARNKKKDTLFSNDEQLSEDFEHYGGLESMTWDLDNLYKSHFPNLQRRAAFLTLYSYLEYELNRLAKKLQKESKLVVGFEDVAGQGVKRSLIYMEKVVRLQIDETAWGKISSLNNLRNLIIHNDGRINDHNNEQKTEVKGLRQLYPHVDLKEDEIMLERGFLRNVLERFEDLFKYLDKAINLKYESKLRRIASFKRTMRNRKEKRSAAQNKKTIVKKKK